MVYTFMNDFSDFSYTFMNDFCVCSYTFMNDFVSVNYHSGASFFFKIALIAKFNEFCHLFLAYIRKK